jgi:hypothetical protein
LNPRIDPVYRPADDGEGWKPTSLSVTAIQRSRRNLPSKIEECQDQPVLR